MDFLASFPAFQAFFRWFYTQFLNFFSPWAPFVYAIRQKYTAVCTPALLTPTPRVYHPYFTLYVIICKYICKKFPVIVRSKVAVHTVDDFLQIAYKNLPFPRIFSPDPPLFEPFSAGFIRNFKISSPRGHRLYTQFTKNTPPCAPGPPLPKFGSRL